MFFFNKGDRSLFICWLSDLTDHQEDRAAFRLCKCLHSCPTLHCGVSFRLELVDAGGVEGVPISHAGSVVEEAAHRLTIPGPGDGRNGKPCRCYTLELHVCVPYHGHVAPRDPDRTTFWETQTGMIEGLIGSDVY